MDTNYKGFYTEAKRTFKERISDSYLKRFAYGIDASCFSYIPELVVIAHSEEEIKLLFALSEKYSAPLSFRGAGTSLCGQSSSDGVLVFLGIEFESIEVLDDAKSIMLGANVIGSDANAALMPYGKKIGPDPATINSAKIGGIFSNNSSGMCCGVAQNSYQTIKSIRVILRDGSVLDTSRFATKSENIESFISTHADLVADILKLRSDILKDSALKEKIQHKFSIKNTTGYGLNSLTDFEDIKDILNHIFIGAEGSLGFVSRVEYECVEDFKYKACALMFFQNLRDAGECVKILRSNQDLLSSAEIMDYACLESLKSHSAKGEMPEILYKLSSPNCAILIQSESDEKESLNTQCQKIKDLLSATPTLFGVEFSSDKTEMDSWWKLRKGLLPITATTRELGTSVITEDVCFFTDTFTQGLEMLESLFKKYDFKGIIFGHALSGNAHFIITPNLDDASQKERFSAFIDEMVDHVVSFGGSIKAEHGTGRMMAAFVEKEWGEKAYSLNRKIKEIFDPHYLINPDVIISNDPQLHLKNIKTSGLISERALEILNTCMECGFCEKGCPSRDFSLTPRQRIALYKEIERLKKCSDTASLSKLKSIQEEYDFLALDSCATCSMCSTLCPIALDAGKIASFMQSDRSHILADSVADLAQKHLNATLNMAKLPFRIYKIFDPKLPNTYTYSVKSAPDPTKAPDVVYLPSCINRLLTHDSKSLPDTFISLCQKANISVVIPQDAKNLCCSKAFKNNPSAKNNMSQKLKDVFATYSKMPVVMDHSACSLELKSVLKDMNINVMDISQYIATYILPRLDIKAIDRDIAIYTPCTLRKLGSASALDKIAHAFSPNVSTHAQTLCCGFAGDKGFTMPKLNQSALKRLVRFYEHKDGINEGYSTSSTCEIGLNRATNISWRHIAYLVDENSSDFNTTKETK